MPNSTGYEDPIIFINLPAKLTYQLFHEGNQGTPRDSKEKEEEWENNVVISKSNCFFKTKLFQRLVGPLLPESISNSTLIKFGQVKIDCLNIFRVWLHSPANL